MIIAASPLISIDAVVIDTETTGLDPRTARVVELGALRIARGHIERGRSFHCLVRPDIAIPHAASVIHGIDDAKVRSCPVFVQAWPKFSAFVGHSIVIGHSIGFDFAVLREECRRAGIEWANPVGLDTRLLAQIVHGRLPDYSLEHLASWLGIEVAQRHTAMGDAAIAAGIFQKLVPLLRDRGIRTVSEAIRACRDLPETAGELYHAGWLDVTEVVHQDGFDGAGPRIDTYPYRQRVGEIMSTPAKSVTTHTPLGDALTQMANARISSVLVSDDRGSLRAENAGIVTERDVLRTIAARGAEALTLPSAEVMSRPLAAVNADAYAYVAIGRMNRLGIRHLGVVDDAGHVVGVLSARDFLHLRAESALMLGDDISQAADAPALARCWSKLTAVAAGLRAEGLAGQAVAEIVSRQLGALTRRAAMIAEDLMKESGRGLSPATYAVAVLGSAGRGESMLAADQDNALIFSNGASDGPEDRWFAELGEHTAHILHEAGLPYCKGGVMAKNAEWRGDIATWQKRVGQWVDRSDPRDLLNVDIFFDLRGVHGDVQMADRQWRKAFDVAKGRADFGKLLVDSTGPTPATAGWFGRLKTEHGRIDLKKAGLLPIVSAARALAICYHVIERSTVARLDALTARGIAKEDDVEMLKEAHATFVDFILDQQLEDVQSGIAPSNSVVVARLSLRDRNRLKNALKSTAHLDELVRDLLFVS